MNMREESWAERALRMLSGEPDPDPRILNSSAEAPRLMLAWWLWFTAIVLILCAAFLLTGCAASEARPASVPECQPWNAEAVFDDDGDVEAIVVDAQNILRLYALMQGLAHGTCRLPSPSMPQKGEQRL